MSASTYNPPAYLIKSSGLTVAQLRSQFEDFKRTVNYIPTAPELVFDRVLANAFAVETRSAQEANGVATRLDLLVDEIATLSTNIEDMKDSIKSSLSGPPAPRTGVTPPTGVTPIKFTFVHGEHGISTRAEPYKNFSGNYGAGCMWSDLQFTDPDAQCGVWNSIEVAPPGPKPRRWQVKIPFQTHFRRQPVVMAWFSGIDIRSKRPCSVEITVEYVSTTGFEVYIELSEEYVWHSIGISWVAVPKEGNKYSWNTFEEVVYANKHDNPVMAGILHDLPNVGREPQSIVLGVRKLVIGCGGTMPFLLSQRFPIRNKKPIMCDITVDDDATGMYVVGAICIVRST